MEGVIDAKVLLSGVTFCCRFRIGSDQAAASVTTVLRREKITMKIMV